MKTESPQRKVSSAWDVVPMVAVAVTALALASALTWRIERVEQAADWVDHTDQVIAQIHDVQRLIVQTQTGLRGFVLTEDPMFLEPYQSGRVEVLPAVDRLMTLTSDNPQQQARVGDLRAELRRWLGTCEEILAAERTSGRGAAMIAEGDSKAMVDDLGRILANMDATEKELRARRVAVARREAHLTREVSAATLVVLAVFLTFSVIQRRRAHAELERVDQRFHALTDQLTEYAVYLLEPDGTVASWNEGARRVKGYTAEEIIGKPLATFYTPDDRRRGKPEHGLREAAAKGKFASEGWRVRKDGTWFWADVVLTALRDDRGNLIGYGKVTRDLSEKRRRELQDRLLAEVTHALSQTLDFETVFKKTAEMVVPALADWAQVDLQFEDGSVRRIAVVHSDASKADAVRRYQECYARVPVGEEGVLRVIQTGLPLLVRDQSPQQLHDRSHDPESYELITALGIRSWVIVPLEARGRTFGALSLIASDREMTEDDLRIGSEIAERASLIGDNVRLLQTATEEARQRSELMAIVSHDLHNPIHAIRLSAQVLRRIVAQLGEDSPRRHRLEMLASTIEREAEHGNRLITDLLDTAKLESGTFTLNCEPTRLDELVHDAVQLFAPIAAEKGLTLAVDVPELTLLSDPHRLVQVLSNLIANAIKFTKPGGRITVRAISENGLVRVGVSDTGRGIPASAIPKVFDRFWQAKETRRAGAGLGLSIARGIVEAHGGRIWVESEPGVGTTFWFTLPKQPAVSAGAPLH